MLYDNPFYFICLFLLVFSYLFLNDDAKNYADCYPKECLMQPRMTLIALLLPAATLLSACNQNETPKTIQSMANSESVTETTVTPAPDDDIIMSADTNQAPQDLAGLSAIVYKDANCGCCEQWVTYAGEHGMKTTVQHPANMALTKDKYGVPVEARSCHTAVTSGGYVFEGHVPAKYVAQFLKNPPSEAKGLAVAGMPLGSPGMEYQNKFDPYDVLQINKDGTTQVYVHVDSASQQI